MTVTMYDIAYDQSGILVSIVTCWQRPNPSRVPSDCVVLEVEMDESLAELIGE